LAREELEGLLFVSLMFLGMGVGLLAGKAGVGTILGLGAGFLAMALWRLWGRTASG
jgi:hypothetical protein